MNCVLAANAVYVEFFIILGSFGFSQTFEIAGLLTLLCFFWKICIWYNLIINVWWMFFLFIINFSIALFSKNIMLVCWKIFWNSLLFCGYLLYNIINDIVAECRILLEIFESCRSVRIWIYILLDSFFCDTWFPNAVCCVLLGNELDGGWKC